jgi:hypothetical protein
MTQRGGVVCSIEKLCNPNPSSDPIASRDGVLDPLSNYAWSNRIGDREFLMSPNRDTFQLVLQVADEISERDSEEIRHQGTG